MPSLRTVTLGCKVNQYETEYLREGFLRLGFHDADDGEPADLCIVNTCTVTSTGDQKSRKAIRQLARRNPAAEIIVMGCYATRMPEAVAELPGVVEVVTDKRQLPELLARRGLVDVPSGISTFGRRRRAYVKVQDGCRMSCSYCIIPTVRPILTSRPMDDVLREIDRLVGNGHREIVLTGVHLGHYGVDLSGGMAREPKVNLAQLVKRIVELDGPFRLRLSSLEAVEVSAELIDLMAARADRICPHVHVSMQSGSDSVLQRMKRRWAGDRFSRHCQAIRQALDQAALTTDVIVGFPGETDSEFEATCAAVESIGFSKIHVFRFSPRQGTAAAEMPNQVPQAVKRDRAARLAEIGRRLRGDYFESLLGRQLRVLVERTVENRLGRVVGTSDRYAPVEFSGKPSDVGRFVRVTAREATDGGIVGTKPVIL